MAKKKSPAELKEEGAEIGSQLALARKRPLNFAILVAKDGIVLETDLKKATDVLWRNAKKAGGGTKGAKGQLSVKGKVIELTCDDENAPGNLPKLARRFLKDRMLPYAIVMITPSGTVTGGEEGDEEDEASPGAPALLDETSPEGERDAASDPDGQETDSGGAGDDTGEPVDPAPETEEDPLRADLRARLDGMAEEIALARRSLHPGAAMKVAKLVETFEQQLATSPQRAAGMLKLLQGAVDAAIAFGVAEQDPSGGSATGHADETASARVEAKARRMSALGDLKQRIADLIDELA